MAAKRTRTKRVRPPTPYFEVAGFELDTLRDAVCMQRLFSGSNPPTITEYLPNPDGPGHIEGHVYRAGFAYLPDYPPDPWYTETHS